MVSQKGPFIKNKRGNDLLSHPQKQMYFSLFLLRRVDNLLPFSAVLSWIYKASHTRHVRQHSPVTIRMFIVVWTNWPWNVHRLKRLCAQKRAEFTEKYGKQADVSNQKDQCATRKNDLHHPIWWTLVRPCQKYNYFKQQLKKKIVLKYFYIYLRWPHKINLIQCLWVFNDNRIAENKWKEVSGTKPTF